MKFTISFTLVTEFGFVPKFQAAEYFFGFRYCLNAKIIYPQGLKNVLPWSVEIRFLIIIFFFVNKDLITSGISLFFDQSPPPITFPALTLEIA